MRSLTLSHEIQCGLDRFWETFFDKQLVERLYKEALGFPEFRITEQSETPEVIRRSVVARPKMNLPGPVAKLFGANFGYREEGTFDKATKMWRWKMIPTTLADKLHFDGRLRAEPQGDARVRRVVEFELDAKVFGIGGMIESSIEKQLREGWDTSALATNAFLANPGGSFEDVVRPR